MKKSVKEPYRSDGQDRLLPKFSLFIFDRARLAAILWLCLTVFGIFSYTTFLKREGFPSIDIPFSVMNGAYFVDDTRKVDADIAKPISDLVLKDDRVASVQTQSHDSFYSVIVQYDEGINATAAGKELEKQVTQAGILPKQATLKVDTPKLGFTQLGHDAVVSVYAKEEGASVQDIYAEAQKVATYLKEHGIDGAQSIEAISPFTDGVNPATGQTQTTQTSFDRYGVRMGNSNVFHDSVGVGIVQQKNTDVIKLDDQVRAALERYNREHASSNFTSTLSASYAPDIKDQISELQRALLEGLLAVLVIGSIVIAIRASIITVLAMLTVLAITLSVLFLIGYSLNTITLFSLVLCLGLIVDDTIIMVEAIDAQRRRRKEAREVVRVATRKVSRAMVAATLTAALSFAPLLFVGGILGGFIRAIPVTVITSLLVSLAVALVFIPLFARYLLLGKKQLGAKNVHEPAARIEAKVAAFVGKPMLWARHSKKKLFGVGTAAVVFGLAFIGAGGFLFSKVTFNIFPPTKDTNGLTVQMQFAPGTTITQAEAAADRADQIVAENLGENFKQASYYTNATNQNANLVISIISYKERDIRSPELQKQLQEAFEDFEGANVKVGQLDVGPPPSAFTVRVETDNREAAERLASDLNTFLTDRELTRPSGEKARIVETTVSDPGDYTRADGKLYMQVSAQFDGTDTTTLVTLAQTAVKDEFTPEKLRQYGLNENALQFDFGQESENQESFQSLALAFPVLLFAIYVLLAVQFRSLAQPLLIFMAIPFSLFGITLGLYLTDNAFSFFAMLGFFALIGLSIKNTILLTDYANQLRRTGMHPVDAAVGALEERFRPLIATSFTAVVSLIPLAVMSPFWEGLAVVLIFGLLSSTFLVITVFPYYYLGAEFLRYRVSRKACLLWLSLSVALVVALSAAGASAAAPLAPLAVFVTQLLISRRLRRRTAKS